MLWFQFTNIGTIEFGKLLQACTNVNLTAAQFLKITFTTELNLDQSFKINFVLKGLSFFPFPLTQLPLKFQRTYKVDIFLDSY